MTAPETPRPTQITPEKLAAAKADLDHALADPACLERLRRAVQRETKRLHQGKNGNGVHPENGAKS